MEVALKEWTVIELWPYAVMLIAFFSWALYHFLAPKNWRDWAGAGVLQAFVIALYGEMYGFPLTIYVLTAFMPAKIPMSYESGHLWATLLGFGRGGDVMEALLGFVFIATGLVLIVKGWVRIYFAHGEMTTGGVYRFVRHPQYAGIFLAMFGQLLDWPTIPTLVLAPIIIVLYVRLALKEEQHMANKFGSPYREYQQNVPMFFVRPYDIKNMFGRHRFR